MAATIRKIARIIAAGLGYAARATALHEGMAWDDETRRLPARAKNRR